MKNILKKLLRESLLDEAAFNMNHLPEDVALFVGPQGIDLTLYSPESKHVYANINAALRNSELGYDVDNVAAEKGFGPFIYELAMMQASKKGMGLMPNRRGDVRGEAFNVWEKFYNRDDVQKKTIEPMKPNGEVNPFYRIDILTGDEAEFEDYDDFMNYYNDLNVEEKKGLAVFNTVYSMKPNSQYNVLIKRAKDYEANGFKTRIAISAGDRFFQEKYD